MRYRNLSRPSATVLVIELVIAILVIGSDSAFADPITDFDGLEVQMAVDVTSDGGQSFFATLVGSNTATIGAGHEFTLNVGASGFSTNTVRVDFNNAGLVNAYADSQFTVGNTNFNNFSFDVTFSLLDAEITSAISSGDLIRGDASASGVDPVVWTFINEQDNSFGNIMTFGPVEQTTPKVQLSASSVPEPSAATLLGLVSTALFFKRRRLLHDRRLRS